MKKIFIYFVIGFFNIHSFCTKAYGAETKTVLSITDQLKNALKKRTSEVASLNKKNKLQTSSNNVIKLEELKSFVQSEELNSIESIDVIRDLNEALRPNYTRSSNELSRLLEEARGVLVDLDPQVTTERLSPPEKKKLIEEMKGLKEKASEKEIALRKNPSKKFDPKILQQVNANLLAKVLEAEILYNKKDPKLTDERIRQTLLLAKTAQNVMEGLSNMNDILSGVEEKRSALNMAKNYFSKYDSDEKVYDLLQNIDKSLKTLDGFDQDNGSENTFAFKNKIEYLGQELYGKSMGFDRSDKENKKHLLETAEIINKEVGENKKLWDQNLSELENLMQKVNQTSEEMKKVKIQVKEGNQKKTESEKNVRKEKVQKNKENKELDSIRDAQLTRIWKINNPNLSEEDDQKEKERIEKLKSEEKEKEIALFYNGKNNKSPVKSVKK